MPELPASFVRDGASLVPRSFTESGWAPNTLMGKYLSGLVAWGAERHAEPDLQPARLTVDMFRPAPMAPARVETTVVRDGRRIRVIDVSILVDDAVICRGSVVFLRRSREPRGGQWLPGEWSVPPPEALEPTTGENGWVPPWEQRVIGPEAGGSGRGGVWIRESHLFVEDEPLTPFVRAALAADNANGQLNFGELGLAHINADLTMTLARQPTGTWIGLDAISRAAAGGVAVGTADIYDQEGRLGQVTLIGVADERHLPPE